MTVKAPSQKLLSIIIPVFNAEHYVVQAVESALSQKEVGEILLIEDASPDNSLLECKKLADLYENVKLLQHPCAENRGAAESRNLGIMNAKYPLIAFLDADDYYLPGRFEKACTIMLADKSVDGVYEAVGSTFDSEEAKVWWDINMRSTLTTLSKDVTSEELFDVIFKNKYGLFHTNGITVRKSLFAKTGLFTSKLKMCQDVCMWWKMSIVGRLLPGSLKHPVAMRRVHGDNRIIRHQKLHPKYEFLARLELLRWLPKKYRTKDRVIPIIHAILTIWRCEVMPSIPLLQRKVRYVALLFSLLKSYPGILSDGYFRHGVKDATGLLYIRNYIKGEGA